MLKPTALKTKRQAFISSIISVLTHGHKSWKPIKSQTKRFCMQMRYRCLLSISLNKRRGGSTSSAPLLDNSLQVHRELCTVLGRQASISGGSVCPWAARDDTAEGPLGTKRSGDAVPMFGTGSHGSSAAHGAGPTTFPASCTNEHGMTVSLGEEQHPWRDRDAKERFAHYHTLAWRGAPSPG